MGDHTESLQIDFDPAQISYEELLGIFWKTHNPCAQAWSRQYMSAVFYQNERQHELILKTREAEAARRGRPIATHIAPLTAFYRAEDYHQKHALRRSALLRDFEAMYPDATAFTDSTAAARVNGYLGGHGTSAILDKEIDQLGLSEEGQQTLRDRVRGR